MRGRRLAFDYGDARIGVAVCDPDGILSSPLPYIENRKSSVMKEISAIITEYEPIEVFLGWPLHLSGSSSATIEKIEVFAQQLRDEFSVRIIFVDERLSTVGAQRQLKDAGVSMKDSKSLIDSMAAVSILEQGLLIQSHAKDSDAPAE